MTDPISDMLTRVRNAILAGKTEVVLPYSKFKHSVAEVMKSNGWINNVEQIEAAEDGFKDLKLTLKYDENGLAAIRGLKRISRPGQRIYSGSKDIPYVKFGVGMTILSTPKGIMTDQDARKENVGGEVVCQIW